MLTIPNVFADEKAVKIWLSRMKLRFGDDWKLVIYKTLYISGMDKSSIHPLIKKH